MGGGSLTGTSIQMIRASCQAIIATSSSATQGGSTADAFSQICWGGC